ncbi:MAG: exodeoxyribonuclease VII large subunit [Pseudomonadota bacterium]
MSDFSPLGETAGSGGNLPHYTVSELSQALKRVVEGNFERVRVRGEISGFKRAASGHLYMALKDESAVIDGVCWRGMAGRLGIAPEDGMEVVASGRLTTYPGRSKYQIVIDAMELAGEGALLKLLEDRRRKLAAEGLFDPDRKQALPFLPEVIGVVTSPTGAVIRDILHRLSERFPRRVLLWPVLVQGEGAAAQVAAAIRGFNDLAPDGPVPRPDLLIVARGGGSLEDLWAFNEEVVVRAAAESKIPLISAVGHETDTTLIDHASDRRAPTPTAAAEIAVPVRAELLGDLLDYARRLVAASSRSLEERRLRVEGLGRGLPDPRRLLDDKTQRLDDRAERLANAAAGLLERRRGQLAEWGARLPHPGQQLTLARERLDGQTRQLGRASERALERAGQGYARLDAARRLGEAMGRRWDAWGRELSGLGRILESTSYRNVLARGFTVVQGPDGLITRAEEAKAGEGVTIEFADGSVPATLGEGAPKPAKRPRAKSSDDNQGRLL